jgi:hypothetical protein
LGKKLREHVVVAEEENNEWTSDSDTLKTSGGAVYLTALAGILMVLLSWAILFVTMSVLTIWALTVHGRDINMGYEGG